MLTRIPSSVIRKMMGSEMMDSENIVVQKCFSSERLCTELYSYQQSAAAQVKSHIDSQLQPLNFHLAYLGSCCRVFSSFRLNRGKKRVQVWLSLLLGLLLRLWIGFLRVGLTCSLRVGLLGLSLGLGLGPRLGFRVGLGLNLGPQFFFSGPPSPTKKTTCHSKKKTTQSTSKQHQSQQHTPAHTVGCQGSETPEKLVPAASPSAGPCGSRCW